MTALRLLLFLALAFLPAVAGSFFRPGEWYQALDKPSWTPPGWLFPVAWTVLYATIGVSGWLAWEGAGDRPRTAAFAVYAAQLLANAAWSPLFFGLRRPDLALADIAVLVVLIALNVLLFARLRPLAAALLAPYLLWVSFATALNAAIWLRNG